MNVLTHALLPVLATRVARPQIARNGYRDWIIIGIAGALPDCLAPHLSLAARMSSVSHGLPAWCVFSLVMLCFVRLTRGKLSYPIAAISSAAYASHLLGDALSGGIAWLYPFSDRSWGDYWISPLWWIPLDILCFLLAYYVFRLQPLLAKRTTPRN